MPRETHTFSAHVDLGTLTRVDPGQIGAVGGRDRRADRTVALSYTGVMTQTACWEERSQVCDGIRLTLAEVRRRTPSAEPARGPRGTTPRLTVRGTTAGAPPPPPPPAHGALCSVQCATAHWVLHTEHGAVCSVQCAIHSVQCALQGVQCALQCGVCITLCSVQFVTHSVQCPVCNTQYAVCSVQYTVCSGQCAIHSLQ